MIQCSWEQTSRDQKKNRNCCFDSLPEPRWKLYQKPWESHEALKKRKNCSKVVKVERVIWLRLTGRELCTLSSQTGMAESSAKIILHLKAISGLIQQMQSRWMLYDATSTKKKFPCCSVWKHHVFMQDAMQCSPSLWC